MADAPANRDLRQELERARRTREFSRLNLETAVLQIMGTVVICMRHVLEKRIVTAPSRIAAEMSAGMLRALGVSSRRAKSVAARAAAELLSALPPKRQSIERR
jgi:hypothetical protein